MTTIDWTKKDKPWKEAGFYNHNYRTNIFSVDSETYDSDIERNILVGIIELCKFYNKRLPANFGDIVKQNVSNNEIYIDPRPICGPIRILLKISQNDLDNAPTLSTESIIEQEGLILVDTSTKEFFYDVMYLSGLMEGYYKFLAKNKKYLYIENKKIVLHRSLSILLNFNSTLSKLFAENNKLYNKNSVNYETNLTLVYDQQYRFSGILVNDELMSIGMEYFRNLETFSDPFVNRVVSGIKYFKTQISNKNLRSTRMDRIATPKEAREISETLFLFGIRESMTDVEPSLMDNVLAGAGNFGTRVADNFFRSNLSEFNPIGEDGEWSTSNMSLPRVFREDYRNGEYDKFKNSLSAKENCTSTKKTAKQILNFLTNDEESKSLYSTKADMLKKNASQRDSGLDVVNPKKNADFLSTLLSLPPADLVSVRQGMMQKEDFVGDNIISDALENDTPTDLDTVYDNILNKISLNKLVSLAVQCLSPETEDLPCVEIYVPFVFDIPEIPQNIGIWSFLGKIVSEAFMLAIQGLTIALIEELFKVIKDCEISKEDFLNNEDPSNNPFADNLPAAEAYLAKSLADSLNDVETNASAAAGFLNDFSLAFTPTEMCMLVSGTASEQLYKTVLCLIERRSPRLYETINTIEKVVIFLAGFGPFFNSSICSNFDRDEPEFDSFCSPTTSMENMRRELLANKGGLTNKQIEEELDRERQRRIEKIENLKKILDQDERNKMIFGENPEEFLSSLIPTSGEDETTRTIISRTIEQSYSPFFNLYDNLVKNITVNTNKIDELKSNSTNIQKVSKFVRDKFETFPGQTGSIKYGDLEMDFVYDLDDYSYGQEDYWDLNIFQDLIKKSLPTLEITTYDNFYKNEDRKPYLQTLNDNRGMNTNYQLSMPYYFTLNDVIRQIFVSFYELNFKSEIFSDQDPAQEIYKFLKSSEDSLELLNEESAVFRKCWPSKENNDLVDGIMTTFQEYEKIKRDSESLAVFVSIGLIYMYYNLIILDFLVKNIGIMDLFGDSVFKNKSISDYIKRKISETNFSSTYYDKFSTEIEFVNRNANLQNNSLTNSEESLSEGVSYLSENLVGYMEEQFFSDRFEFITLILKRNLGKREDEIGALDSTYNFLNNLPVVEGQNSAENILQTFFGGSVNSAANDSNYPLLPKIYLHRWKRKEEIPTYDSSGAEVLSTKVRIYDVLSLRLILEDYSPSLVETTNIKSIVLAEEEMFYTETSVAKSEQLDSFENAESVNEILTKEIEELEKEIELLSAAISEVQEKERKGLLLPMLAAASITQLENDRKVAKDKMQQKKDKLEENNKVLEILNVKDYDSNEVVRLLSYNSVCRMLTKYVFHVEQILSGMTIYNANNVDLGLNFNIILKTIEESLFTISKGDKLYEVR